MPGRSMALYKGVKNTENGAACLVVKFSHIFIEIP
jgi:hypothetical protein